jgi:16S rRNA (guanine527-N7)-methyltransferase
VKRSIVRNGGEALDAVVRRHGLPREATARLKALLDQLARPEAPTAVHDRRSAMEIHIADSLVALEVAEIRVAGVIADLGSGAGLPGLVLTAAVPDARVFLVEAARRKCEFLRSAVRAMGLENAEVVWTRVEEWTEGIGRCDVVCARAVAALPVLCEYAAPLLRDNGVLVAWKGTVPDSEAADAAAAASHLGLVGEPVRSVIPFPGSARRTLHVYRKTRPTPAEYPRRAGIATKRPLSERNLR